MSAPETNPRTPDSAQKEPSMVRQKDMIAGHYTRLAHAAEELHLREAVLRHQVALDHL